MRHRDRGCTVRAAALRSRALGAAGRLAGLGFVAIAAWCHWTATASAETPTTEAGPVGVRAASLPTPPPPGAGGLGDGERAWAPGPSATAPAPVATPAAGGPAPRLAAAPASLDGSGGPFESQGIGDRGPLLAGTPGALAALAAATTAAPLSAAVDALEEGPVTRPLLTPD